MLHPAPPGQALEVVLGHRTGGDRGRGDRRALEPDDWILPMHRNLGVFTDARGRPAHAVPPALREGRRLHQGARPHVPLRPPAHRIVGMISHLGAMLPVADGLALAAQLRGERRVAAPFTGDGATSEGDFHEAVNLAAVWKLPVLFVVENNQYGLSTPATEQYACADLADRAVGYGIPGEIVDGNDLLAVFDGGDRAPPSARARGRRPDAARVQDVPHARARGGLGHRLRAPSTCSRNGPGRTRSRASRSACSTDGVADARRARDSIRAELKAHDRRAGRRGAGRPDPDSTAERELADVYARPAAPADTARARRRSRRGARREAAARAALRRRDPRRPARRDASAGRRSSSWARTSRSTAASSRSPRASSRSSARRACATRRSSSRARSAPRSASPSTASCRWSRCSSATSSPAASTRSSTTWPRRTTAGARGSPSWCACPSAAASGAGPFHSQNVEAWFTHVAGLKVVAPATPYDAKGLLLAAFEDGNPVLYLEHKLLYRSAKGRCPPATTRVPIGQARVAREGHGRDGRDLRRRRVVGARGRRRAGRRRARDRGDRPAHAAALGPRDGAARRCGRRAGRSSCTRRRITGGFGGEIAATIGAGGLRGARRAGGAARRARHARAVQQGARGDLLAASGGCCAALRELLAY